jgi:hypothetical protein
VDGDRGLRLCAGRFERGRVDLRDIERSPEMIPFDGVRFLRQNVK